MQYSVYQIVMDEQDHVKINTMDNPRKNHPKLAAHMAAITGDFQKAMDSGMYSEVAVIEADDLDGVFHIGNVGPEENITRLDQMHSVSVGDLIKTPDGQMFAVANHGFTEVDFK